jgi:type III secretion protein S
MGPDLLGLTRDALSVVLWVSLPLVVVATVVGLGVAILQAVTQIQDQSIGQSVRLVVVLVGMLVGLGWIGGEVLRFGERAFGWMEQLP